MELDDSNVASSSSTNDGSNKQQSGERNLAARRHTVGPSDTPHDQVLGNHYLGVTGSPFYPMAGLAGLAGLAGYTPLNLFTQMTSVNPFLSFNPSMAEGQPNFDLCAPASAMPAMPISAGSGIPDPASLLNGTIKSFLHIHYHLFN